MGLLLNFVIGMSAIYLFVSLFVTTIQELIARLHAVFSPCVLGSRFSTAFSARHCEQSEAIQRPQSSRQPSSPNPQLDCFAALAMTGLRFYTAFGQ